MAARRRQHSAPSPDACGDDARALVVSEDAFVLAQVRRERTVALRGSNIHPYPGLLRAQRPGHHDGRRGPRFAALRARLDGARGVDEVEEPEVAGPVDLLVER